MKEGADKDTEELVSELNRLWQRAAKPEELDVERKQAVEALQKAHDELDLNVEERTADLTIANEALQREITMRRRMEKALERERDFNATILSTVDALVIVLDLQGCIVSFNQACETCTGYRFDEVLGRPFRDFFLLPEEKDPVKAVFADLKIEALPNRIECFWLTKDRRRRLIAWSNSVLKDTDGSIEFVMVTGVDITERRRAENKLQRHHDNLEARVVKRTAGLEKTNEQLQREITERKRNEEALQESEKRYRSLITEMYNGFALHEIICDETGVPCDYRFLEVNPAFERLTGLRGAEIVGKNMSKVLPQTESYWVDTFGQVALTEKPMQYENYAQEFDKTFDVLAYSPKKGQFATVFTDVTARKKAELRLKHIATHDILTDLPNRLLFLDYLQHGLALAKRQKYQLALLFLDLNDFKSVNDTYGHDIGDQLLKVVAGRLNACVRESDRVARLSGDEFMVLLENIPGKKSVVILANKILDESSKPFELDGHMITVTTSIGISIYPNDGSEPEILLKKADEAMYVAKRQGKNRYCFSV